MTKRQKAPEDLIGGPLLSAGQRILRDVVRGRGIVQGLARQHIPVPGHAAEAEVVIEPIASPEDLGALVRSVRTKRGMSQQEFADLAGVGRRFVSELERGKPTLEIGRVLTVLLAAGIDLVAKER